MDTRLTMCGQLIRSRSPRTERRTTLAWMPRARPGFRHVRENRLRLRLRAVRPYRGRLRPDGGSAQPPRRGAHGGQPRRRERPAARALGGGSSAFTTNPSWKSRADGWSAPRRWCLAARRGAAPGRAVHAPRGAQRPRAAARGAGLPRRRRLARLCRAVRARRPPHRRQRLPPRAAAPGARRDDPRCAGRARVRSRRHRAGGVRARPERRRPRHHHGAAAPLGARLRLHARRILARPR